MNGKVTYNELKATFPEEKKSVESLYGRIVPARKISYWMTIPFIYIGTTAFQASVISIFISILASFMLCIPNSMCRVIGVILVPLWHIFDCVDGNIARYTKSASEYGETVDAISGYYMFAFLPFALGAASYNIGENYLNLNPSVYLFLGGLAAICDVLLRLIHQKYAYTGAIIEIKSGQYVEKGDHQYTLTGFNKIRKLVDVEMGPVGIPMFILFLCPIFNLYHLLTIYYSLYFFASLLGGTIYYLHACKRERE